MQVYNNKLKYSSLNYFYYTKLNKLLLNKLRSKMSKFSD